jgi:hypothetical protein
MGWEGSLAFVTLMVLVALAFGSAVHLVHEALRRRQ